MRLLKVSLIAWLSRLFISTSFSEHSRDAVCRLAQADCTPHRQGHSQARFEVQLTGAPGRIQLRSPVATASAPNDVEFADQVRRPGEDQVLTAQRRERALMAGPERSFRVDMYHSRLSPRKNCTSGCVTASDSMATNQLHGARCDGSAFHSEVARNLWITFWSFARESNL